MKLTVKIDLSAAIRRGLNAPAHINTIDIDPAQLTQPQRDWLAENVSLASYEWCRDYGLRRDEDLTLQGWVLEQPSLQGLAEAADRALVKQAADRASAEASEKEAREKEAAQKAERVQQAISHIVRDGSLLTIDRNDLDIYPDAESAIARSGRKGYLPNVIDALPETVLASLTAQEQRRDALRAERKAQADADADAVEARIVAAVEARLTPTQQQMRARGMLDLASVRSAVLKDDAQETCRTIAAQLGDAYDVEVAHWWQWNAKKAPNQKQFRQLAKIEQMLGLAAQDTYIDELGRGRITVHLRVRSALDQDVTLAVTYPASIE